VSAILNVLDEAAAFKDGPSVIIAETVKGKGISFAENTAAFHNAALTQEQYDKALVEIEESGRMVQ
jgi:transketolase